MSRKNNHAAAVSATPAVSEQLVDAAMSLDLSMLDVVALATPKLHLVDLSNLSLDNIAPEPKPKVSRTRGVTTMTIMEAEWKVGNFSMKDITEKIIASGVTKASEKVVNGYIKNWAKVNNVTMAA